MNATWRYNVHAVYVLMIGEPDATSIAWRKLKLNELTRCAECGAYYILKKGNPINIPLDEPEHH